MILIVLMAGDGKRFTEKGYNIPKPFLKIKDNKSILDYTMSSLPETNDKIYFAVRSEWDDVYIKEIKEKYPNNEIIYFDKLTRGNLETAYITSCKIEVDENDHVLFLDSDNMYNGKTLIDFINDKDGEFGVVSCFKPIDESYKWAFVIHNNNIATKIVEKDPTALKNGGLPMIGTFGFSSMNLFKTIAKKLIDINVKVKNEFYMSQSMQYLIDNKIPVYVYKSDTMVPMGIPEDYENLIKELK